MYRALWLVPILLPLGGCYLPPAAPDYGYAQPYYPQPVYPPPGYAPPGYAPPGYAAPEYAPPAYAQPPGYDPYAGYPGYSYNGGAPVFYDSGIAVPLVFFGGGWGYYDRSREWHRAPEGLSRDLSARRDGGGDFHPNGQGRPQGFNQGAAAQPFHPGAQPQRPLPAAGAAPPVRLQPQPQVRQQVQPRPQAPLRACEPNQRC